MTFTTGSYAVFDSKSDPQPYELTRRDLLDDDVLIRILYSGICHSDIHIAHDEWNSEKFPIAAKYPVIPGHEIVGTVEKIGKDVTKHKVGDVVAVGLLVDSCSECDMCKHGQECFCSNKTLTFNSIDKRTGGGSYTAGGYSDCIVVRDEFALSVPKALQTPELLPGVAPILCAGVTTFSPMMQFGLSKGQKCAIAGLGGLGLMGVKLAKALGAEVTVVSRSHRKDAYARELGADHVIASSDPEEMKANFSKFDLIIDTIPWSHDLNPYIALARPLGTMALVGHIGEVDDKIHTGYLLLGNRRLAGSYIGNLKETQELLNLCAEHKLIATYDLIKMQEIPQAWKKIDEGASDRRFIIDVEQFRKDKAAGSA